MDTCPHCFSKNIKKDGFTIKGFQRFFCHFCGKYSQGNYIRKKANMMSEQKIISSNCGRNRENAPCIGAGCFIEWAKNHPVLSQYFIAETDDEFLKKINEVEIIKCCLSFKKRAA